MVGNVREDQTPRFEEQRARLRDRYLKPEGARPPSSARGLHHTALVSSDANAPSFTKMYSSSRHQAGREPRLSAVALLRHRQQQSPAFDFPGLDVGPYREVLGRLHHVAIALTRNRWDHLRTKPSGLRV
jgi:hypothetical protein